jgi:uncharacterized protein DUF6976
MGMNMLCTVQEVGQKIRSGDALLLAGSEEALSQLPKGNWIGGTIPYFMGPDGGLCSQSMIFVTEVPADALKTEVREYKAEELPLICKDVPRHGFTFVIIPAGSSAHTAYAEGAPTYDGIFNQPVVGWISGVHTSEIGKRKPKVFNGLTGSQSTEVAVVMRVSLPDHQRATVDIVNVFEPGPSEVITFPESGFSAQDCFVGGKRKNLARYLKSIGHDQRIPLIADYNGSLINVSLQEVDENTGNVSFYAPVFGGVEYRCAKPVSDYVALFESAMSGRSNAACFSCNCILNYLYADLEGKRTGSTTGPITFGEIAHQLLNQTLVRLLIREISLGPEGQLI